LTSIKAFTTELALLYNTSPIRGANGLITLEKQLMRSGIGFSTEIKHWIKRGEITHNNSPANPETPLQAGDEVCVRGWSYVVTAVENQPRLLLQNISDLPDNKIHGLRRVHCGFHKCLTMYTRRIIEPVSKSPPFKSDFRHFFHRHDIFYRECENHDFSSISGHALDLERFEDLRVSRFLRDPRDMLVSGYFYHKRGAEHC
jgi:hypothetical protein